QQILAPPGDILLRNTPGRPLLRKRNSPCRNSPDQASVSMATPFIASLRCEQRPGAIITAIHE
ncbi:MAG: hypothetical protein Q9M27_04920, partial [Mariprofundaceae bacterium]|nr:hypothetical protein [Mariprofundaceae bacterium]